MVEELSLLLLRRRAGEESPIEVLDDLGHVLATVVLVVDDAAETLKEASGVEQIETLLGRDLVVPLREMPRVAGRTPEEQQKGVGDRTVLDQNASALRRQKGERFGGDGLVVAPRVGEIADHVVQHLGVEAAVREITRHGTALVRSREREFANQRTQPVASVDEDLDMLRVWLLPAEKPIVDTLDKGPGEILPPLAQHPVDERDATILSFDLDDLLLPLARILDPHAGEVVRELLPTLLREIVPLPAQKGQGGDLGKAIRGASRGRTQEVRLGIPEVAAGGEQQRPREAVPRLVVLHKGVNAAMIDVDGVRPEIDREFALHAQNVAEAHGPVVGKGFRGEKVVNQCLLPFGVAREHIALGLDLGGDASGEVDIRPAHEDLVRGASVGLLPRSHARPIRSGACRGAEKVHAGEHRQTCRRHRTTEETPSRPTHRCSLSLE